MSYVSFVPETRNIKKERYFPIRMKKDRVDGTYLMRSLSRGEEKLIGRKKVQNPIFGEGSWKGTIRLYPNTKRRSIRVLWGKNGDNLFIVTE